MILTNVRRYAIFLTIIAVASVTAAATLRGTTAETNVDADTNNRKLQTCGGTKKQCRDKADCEWQAGNCVSKPMPSPTGAPTTNTPTTMEPTSSPTTSPTTGEPTKQITANPTIFGMGYCSDIILVQCWDATGCVCGGAEQQSTTAENPLFNRRSNRERKLAACPTATGSKRNQCPTDTDECAWESGQCVSTVVIPTDPPSKSPSEGPTGQPTKAPTPCECLGLPTDSPTRIPTSSPSHMPTNPPTKLQTDVPTKFPSSSPTNPPSNAQTPIYEYTNVGTSQCESNGSSNWQGPNPLPDKSNVAVQFFAFGDSPYDDNCNSCNTCIGTDGNAEDVCTRYDCTATNQLPYDNTCTYEGVEYQCLKTNIIPYMNEKTMNGEAAFSLHVGDFIKGDPGAQNRRCTEASFTSRKNLFSLLTNFLIVPGDNEWNECYNYNIDSNTDSVREMWRDKFAKIDSPFNQFNRTFPSQTGGVTPTIIRQTSNPENLFFVYNNVAFFGLNHPAGPNYIENTTPDINAEWVGASLEFDMTSCNLISIVIFSHITPNSDVKTALNNYFNSCSILPTLRIAGNAHPKTYCMEKSNEELTLTVEAFRSGPLLVSVVRDPNGSGDYFNVNDADLANSNVNCPSFG